MSPTISFLFFTRKKSKENLLFNEFLDPPRALPSCVRERESWMNGPPARPRPRWPYSFPYIALVQEPPYIYISAGRDLFFPTTKESGRPPRLQGKDACLGVYSFASCLLCLPVQRLPEGKAFFFSFFFSAGSSLHQDSDSSGRDRYHSRYFVSSKQPDRLLLLLLPLFERAKHVKND